MIVTRDIDRPLCFLTERKPQRIVYYRLKEKLAHNLSENIFCVESFDYHL